MLNEVQTTTRRGVALRKTAAKKLRGPKVINNIKDKQYGASKN